MPNRISSAKTFTEIKCSSSSTKTFLLLKKRPTNERELGKELRGVKFQKIPGKQKIQT